MADVIRLAATAINTFLDVTSVAVDNWTFKLFYKVTVGLLITCSVLVGSKQFFGGPISCDAGPARSSLNDDVLKSYCWMYANFKIPPNYQGPCSSSGMDNYEQEAPIYNSYYQWVSIFLFAIAILFYAPRALWLIMEGGLMKHFCKGTSERQVEEFEEKIDKLMRYFNRHVQSRFRVYFSGFIFCQFLNLIVLLVSIGITHIFLHKRFISYGARVWYYYHLPPEEQKGSNPMCDTFPRITSCEYYRYGSGGNQERISALCILSLNIVNDKVFLVLWWWFLILLIAIVFELVSFVFQFFSRRCRYHMIRLRLYRYFKRSRNSEMIREYLRQCSSGDWFVLYQMSKNLNRPFFMEFLSRLAHDNVSPEAQARGDQGGADDVDVGGGSIVDLMLQPDLDDDVSKSRRDKNCGEDEDRD